MCQLMKLCFVLCVPVYIFTDVDAASTLKQKTNQNKHAKPMNKLKDAEVDEMVQNVLQWLQGFYQQNNRKARQYDSGKPERPRPFEPAGYLPPATGYPQPGNKPTPGYNEGSTGDYNSPTSGTNQEQGYPSSTPGQQYQPSTEYTGEQFQPESTNPAYPSPELSNQPQQTRPTEQPGDDQSPSYETEAEEPANEDAPFNPGSEADDSNSGAYQPPGNQVPDGDDRHPPHIHSITVDCGKEMMTINIEFNKVYNGVIYSKGYYKQPECIYVNENSNQIKYSFTVNLNKCGTEFISAFESEGQSYLENTLVLQNEAGIQEQWDHIHRVRCLWEGNLSKQLSSSLSVGMLRQETTNFSGDTAMASLEIQVGRGPFSSPANDLVKIGEIMTLVITVTGDAGFDVQVKQCVAKDAQNINTVQLTDENGCVVKPKLFGAFQKTRETGANGVSVIAYAYFNAFKFPDEMDLLIQCEVELCKTNCDMCTKEQSLEPSKRKKRDANFIDSRPEPVTVGKAFRVLFPEEIDVETMNKICITYTHFVLASVMLLLFAILSCVITICYWFRSHYHKKQSI